MKIHEFISPACFAEELNKSGNNTETPWQDNPPLTKNMVRVNGLKPGETAYGTDANLDE